MFVYKFFSHRFVGFAVATFFYINNEVNFSLSTFLPIIIAGLIIFLFGIIDDFLDLPAKLKFLVQVIATFIMIFSGTRFTQLGPLKFGILSYPITFFWTIGVINAFNLIDGVDGYSSGYCIMACTIFGLFFYCYVSKKWNPLER